MKKAFFILIISSLIFFVQDKISNETDFDKLCSYVGRFINFSENGIRVEYCTKNPLKDEFMNIKDIVLSRYVNSDVEYKKNEIIVNDNNKKIDINIFNNEGKTQVQIDISNYDKRKKLSFLKKEITKLQTENCYEVKYFKYLKGRIYSEQQINEYINSKKGIQNLNILSIHNGYVGTANLNNGERLNIANISYNTGSYLIIGSPIINTTY